MTADTVGGVWTYALELARALGAHGVEMALATMGAPPRPEQRAEIRRLDLTLFESPFKLEWMEDPWEDVAEAGRWLLGLGARFKPDLVHLNGYAHGALPWDAPVLMAGHSCVLSWWEAVKGEPAPPSWNRYRCEVACGLRAADLVVAPTGAMLRALERHYGPLAATRVIANGRAGADVAPSPKESFVLTAGRLWDEAKNVAAVGRAAPLVPWPVYLAGERGHPAGGTAEPTGLHSLGRLAPDALARWYARASIYLLPARYEPFGLSALEAALAGCALVLGDIPSLREVWGETASFVPPDDHEALAAAVNALIADAPRRQGLAAAARRRALSFTPERMAAGYLTAYHELTGGAINGVTS